MLFLKQTLNINHYIHLIGVYYLGLGDILARRRNENRIKTRTRRLNHKPFDPDAELEAVLTNASNRAYSYGKRIYDITQSRKGQGKQVLIQWTKHGIGETTRAFLGPRHSSSKPISIKRPSLSIKKKKPKVK